MINTSQWICLFVFVALRPKSTAMVIAGRSVHLTTLFSWASLNKQLTSNRAHTFACNKSVEVLFKPDNIKVIAWQGLFDVYPHFALQAKEFQ